MSKLPSTITSPGSASRLVRSVASHRSGNILFVHPLEQASHNGEIAHAVRTGRLEREQVAELGRVLLGEEAGRHSAEDITAFDSTGLAVQDLAVAKAVYERYLEDPAAFADVPLVRL